MSLLSIDGEFKLPGEAITDLFVNVRVLVAERTGLEHYFNHHQRAAMCADFALGQPFLKDFGGDGRFDIYLRWAGKGSDGYRVTEACTDGSDGKSPGRCAGYFVMNPSYKGSSYPSELEGIRVLTSHELFHSIQDAYGTGQWRTFSEGSLVAPFPDPTKEAGNEWPVAA